MTSDLLPAWTPEAKRRHGREIVIFQHRLAETGLFEDEALIRLLEAHPRDALDVCTMKRNPPPNERWIGGEANGLSGAELLEAVRRGRLWLNLRRATTYNPEYRAMFERLIRDFSKETGERILTAMGGILISAPRCGIFYHCDSTETMLWHVRGVKTIHLYPAEDPYLSERAYEAALLKETLNDLPYSPEMEAGVTSVVLEPGMAVHWPLHGPHRVVNHDSLNVSISIEYTTPHSMLTNGVFYTNGILRRRFGLNPTSRTVPGVLKPAYWLASKALRRLAPTTNAPKNHARAFDVRLDAPDCIAWRPGFEPAEPMDRAA